jgi:hypothetical protein
MSQTGWTVVVSLSKIDSWDYCGSYCAEPGSCRDWNETRCGCGMLGPRSIVSSWWGRRWMRAGFGVTFRGNRSFTGFGAVAVRGRSWR